MDHRLGVTSHDRSAKTELQFWNSIAMARTERRGQVVITPNYPTKPKSRESEEVPELFFLFCSAS
jgi:hypothetical protein